ncbi:hypothetical protein IUSA1_04305 [Streptococcus iniae IUSA1]|nr:hypothetical protein IUSA1_04305 [Streptococcus iniae IUSA1]
MIRHVFLHILQVKKTQTSGNLMKSKRNPFSAFMHLEKGFWFHLVIGLKIEDII